MTADAPTTRPSSRGVVLLEVVFAVTLFAASGAVILGGMNWSARQVRELRLRAHAADLAVSVLSEIQMGLLELKTDGPYPADPPHQDWTWAVDAQEELGLTEAQPLMVRIEITVTNEAESYSYRLVQLALPPPEGLPAPEDAAADDGEVLP